MAYDGIITYAISKELESMLTLAKIEKVYQPGNEELVLQIHTKEGNVRLFMSVGSQSARVCLTENRYKNPEQPPTFCMLLRKHIQGGRITRIEQYKSERIIEFDIEALNELGFTVCKRLIVEIMGKHSNIVLIDIESGKIIDSIKRISIDVNRYRQLLPGVIYKYPPEQDKVPFKEVTADMALPEDSRSIMQCVGGISPAIAREIETGSTDIPSIVAAVAEGNITPRIYSDEDGTPREFHVIPLSEYEGLNEQAFETVSECVESFFYNRDSSNMVKQKSVPLIKTVEAALDKALLKRKRLGEDLLCAEDSDKYRLYGELLTANIHLVTPGAKSVTVTNYYDGNPISIPLDEKLSASKNAQRFFKKYSKAKTAINEKQIQLEENDVNIAYLESVLQSLSDVNTEEDIEAVRDELVETGFVRFRKTPGRKKKIKPTPIHYTLSDGTDVYVGRNNNENDYLTLKLASKTDVWMHTKDIPGSHLIIKMNDGRNVDDLSAELIYEAASIAAFHSKAGSSANVPVDYVPVRYVKKPNGAKPGMVIFTHNQTVYVDPKLPTPDAGIDADK